uniref:Tr-type G domain-containing protein n=1 Tax=Anopheles coluzzii TaxID=1518534 RepID=A0A8W7PP56_ANOCL
MLHIRFLARRIVGNELLQSRLCAAAPTTILPQRQLQFSAFLSKRRKTAEEKHAVEFAPKKKNKPQTSGVVDIWRNMTVADLARSCQLELEHIQEVMLYVKGAGSIDATARLEDPKVIKDIAAKCGLKTKIVAAPVDESEEVLKDRDVVPRPPPAPENLKERPPVVTVMGHVDHGKTTLLDSLRGASVAAGEAGGITQHIGAFTVELDNGERVTFLDTPGHAAFSAMRARGANLTDIIVLQSVPIIVAINKIDKPGADVERVKKELSQHGIALEGYGGDTIAVGISALHGTNLDELTEAVSTQATLMGLKGEYVGPVEGVVVESKIDSHRGKLSTAIVSRGTLRKGAILVSGQAWAKVRGLFDHAGQPISAVTPGMPVEILGWRELPLAGEMILEVESERVASSVLRWRANQAMKEKALSDAEAISLKRKEHEEQYREERDKSRRSGFYRRKQQGPRQKEAAPDDGKPRINVIVKGDVHGSVEAILDVLETYDDNERCRLDVIHYAVGDVNESDLELARLFDAIIYAFSVNVGSKATKGVTIRPVDIIYRLVDDLKKEINTKLPLVDVEEEIGEANVLQLFDINEGRRKVTVLGCRCTKGLLKKAHKYKVKRNGELLADELSLESMRHLKNEVDSVKKDVECGLRLNDQTLELKAGDTIVCYQINREPQQTEWDPGF